MAGKQFEEKEEGCGNYSHRLGMGSALASVTDCTPPLRRAQRGATPISGDDAVRFLELECPVRFLCNRSEGSCRQKHQNETLERTGSMSMVKFPRCDESATGDASCVASLDQYVGINALRDRL